MLSTDLSTRPSRRRRRRTRTRQMMHRGPGSRNGAAVTSMLGGAHVLSTAPAPCADYYMCAYTSPSYLYPCLPLSSPCCPACHTLCPSCTCYSCFVPPPS